MITTYQKYASSTAEEAAQDAGASYEDYFVPFIDVPSARPLIDARRLP